MRARRSLLPFLLSLAVVSIAVSAEGEVCPDRPGSGSMVTDAVRLESANGILSVDLTMVNSVDEFGISHYCYLYADGSEAPTLVASPGDRVVLNVTNHLTPATSAAMPMSH